MDLNTQTRVLKLAEAAGDEKPIVLLGSPDPESAELVAIIDATLVSGSRLTDHELARRFGLERANVRQALARLAQDGLVRVVPRRGYLVTPISVQDLDEIFSMRRWLEPEGARLAAGRVDHQELRRLDDVCDAASRSSDPDAIRIGLRAHREFHVIIARASGNQRLADAITRLIEDSERALHVIIRSGGWPDPIGGQHREFLEPLAAGDGDRAAAVLRARLDTFHRAVMKIVLSSDQVRSAPIRPSTTVI